MSKLRKDSEYEKTFTYRFFRWLRGEKDLYLNQIEMSVQTKTEEKEETIQERMQERQMIREKIYDVGNNKEIKFFNTFYTISSILFCVVLTAILIITVSHLPETGNANSPQNNEVSAHYIEKGVEETGSINIVTGMILKYRAFDTFGEAHVLFIATICVMALLMVDDEKLKEIAEVDDRKYEPKNDKILQKVAFILVPIIFMFGFYIILNGHLSPGGGFSGGAMLGAGMILYVSAFGFRKMQRFFDEEIFKIVKVSSLVLYAAIISYYFYMGANGFDSHIPIGTPGNILSAGLLLPINILVGMEVACTMYAFYALFRRGGL